LEIEVYDLSTDPQEREDVAHDFPSIVDQAKKIMSAEHVISSLEGFRFPIIDNE
jgi:arylsulfatase